MQHGALGHQVSVHKVRPMQADGRGADVARDSEAEVVVGAMDYAVSVGDAGAVDWDAAPREGQKQQGTLGGQPCGFCTNAEADDRGERVPVAVAGGDTQREQGRALCEVPRCAVGGTSPAVDWPHNGLLPMGPALTPLLPGVYEAPHPDERFAVAPMMDHTNRHFRFLSRLLTRRAVLYTEMVPVTALTANPARADWLLGYTAYGAGGVTEHPLVLQLGGADPARLRAAAALAAPYGYDAVNLNCGCPSETVGKGSFGAVLMRDPSLVECLVLALRQGLADGGRPHTPVTVKCRLGVDDTVEDVDTCYAALRAFVARLVRGPARVRRFEVCMLLGTVKQ